MVLNCNTDRIATTIAARHQLILAQDAVHQWAVLCITVSPAG